MTPEEQLEIAKENLISVNSAINNFLAGNAVVEYQLNTGQTMTKVIKTSLKDLFTVKRQIQSEINELEQLVNGSNIISLRDFQC